MLVQASTIAPPGAWSIATATASGSVNAPWPGRRSGSPPRPVPAATPGPTAPPGRSASASSAGVSGPAPASAAHSPVRIPSALSSTPSEPPSSPRICPHHLVDGRFRRACQPSSRSSHTSAGSMRAGPPARLPAGARSRLAARETRSRARSMRRAEETPWSTPKWARVHRDRPHPPRCGAASSAAANCCRHYLDADRPAQPGDQRRRDARRDRAAETAAAADDARRPRRDWGPLHGLPITIKDSLETAGLRTTAGAPEWAHHVPTRDADAVARLRSAGAIVFGKTNLPAYAADCQTYNPHLRHHEQSVEHSSGRSAGLPAVPPPQWPPG